jgi:hypothetical protein
VDRSSVKRIGFTFNPIPARRLREHGLEEAKGSIVAKISRGAFPATFFIAVMKAIGRQTVNLEEV